MRFKFLILTIGVLVFLSHTSLTFAVGNIKLGSAEIHPYISVSATHDDNIYLDPYNEKDDFITVIRPGFRVDLPFGYEKDQFLQLDYNAEIGIYDKYSSEDYEDQNLNALLKFNFTDYYLRLKNDFKDTSSRANTEFTKRIKRNENETSIVLGAIFNDLSFEVGYEHFFVEYDTSGYAGLDYEEDIGTLTGFYQLFPKTKLLLEYNYGKIDYDTNSTREGDYNQLRVGLDGELTGKTTGVVKVGYQDRNYDTAGEEDWQSGVALVGLVTRLTDLTTIDFNYERKPVESTYSSNNFYEANKVQLALTQRLKEKLTGSLSLRFENNDYPEATIISSTKREDDILTYGASLNYNIQEWLHAILSYQYSDRDSNVDGYDYKRNLVSVGLSAIF